MCRCGHGFDDHGDRAVVACTAFTVVKNYTDRYGMDKFISCNCTGWNPA